MKFRKCILSSASVACLALSGCSGGSEADAEPDEVAQLPDNSDPVGTSTASPVGQECMVAASNNPSNTLCFSRSADQPPEYAPIACSTAAQDRIWIKALSTDPDTAVWVLVDDDTEYVPKDPLPNSIPPKPSSLIYSSNTGFKSAQCNFDAVTNETCPVEGVAPNGQPLGCLGSAVAKDPG